MNTKNAKERVHDWITRGTFDPENGCRHPRDLIAAALELSEKTVSRCTRELELEGRMRVDRPRQRGACNTYFVTNWNPSKRADVLDRIREVKPLVLRLRGAKCPSKGTAGLSRAHTPAESPRRTSTALVARGNNQISARRTMPADPAPKPNLRVVGCPDCERLRIGLEAALLDLDNANTDLTVKRRKITQLQNELAEKHRSDPLYSVAETIYFFWREKCQPKARTFSEDRVKAVLGRLKDKDPRDPAQFAYTPRYICEAVVGGAVAPYVKHGKRFNDLELICRNGRLLEDFHERYELHRDRQEARA